MKKNIIKWLLVFMLAFLICVHHQFVKSEHIQAMENESIEEQDALLREMDTSVHVMPGSRVAVVSKNTAGQFWNLIKSGMEQAVNDVNEAYGYEKEDKVTMTFEGPSDELDVETQINTLDAVISENPTVVCLSASDMDSCQAQMEAARENGIPVVVFDSNVTNDELVSAFRSSDNDMIGRIAAQKMAEALPQGGDIAIFAVQEKTQTARARVESFVSEISNHEEFRVVEIVYQDQVEDFKAAMNEVLETYPDLHGVFCENDETATLYLSLDVAKSKEKPPVMIGVDGSKVQISAIDDGIEYGVVSQNPYEMGYETMIAALTISDDTVSEIENTVLLEPVWLDQSNINDEKYSDFIY